MSRMIKIGLMSSMAMAVVLASWVEAAPRRFFGRRNSSYNYSGGLSQVAPSDGQNSPGLRPLAAYYSYDKAMSDEVAFTDRVRVFLLVRDQDVIKAAEAVTAEVKVTDLTNSQATTVRYCPVSFSPTAKQDYQLGVFDVMNEPGQDATLQPAKVYRMFVNLHTKSEKYDEKSALGRVSSPYYVATAGDSRLERARQHIVMRTFKEYYYAQQGWASEENYPMDCYAYYMWATGSCTVGAQGGRTILGYLFGGRRPFQNGSEIPTIARDAAIHGDYVRMPGHSFMLLAYDRQSGQVWTMEGNFNSTIEVVTRSVNSGWTIGHLVDEHVRPGLFEVSRANSSDEPSRTRL